MKATLNYIEINVFDAEERRHPFTFSREMTDGRPHVKILGQGRYAEMEIPEADLPYLMEALRCYMQGAVGVSDLN